MTLPSEARWIRTYGHKVEPTLRKLVLKTYRKPNWLPCWFQRAYDLVARRRRYRVIVRGQPPSEEVGVATVLERLLPGRIRFRYPSWNGVCMDLGVEEMRRLLAYPGVGRVWRDREVQALMNVAVPTIHSDALWTAGYTGQGVTVAILDTGVEPHRDLVTPENRIAAFVDLVKRRASPYDDHGHGTHVAGDALGNGTSSGGRYRAPAPDARLVAIKVLNRVGTGSMSTILSGLEWCLQHAAEYAIRVVSLSLGSPAESPPDDDPLCLAVEALWDAGITVCVAAGNSGPRPGTITTPGIDPKVITVGAMADKNTADRKDDEVIDFSSRGPTLTGEAKPDILAPGVGIVSLRAEGSYLDKYQPDSRVGGAYFSLSGTSMATPIVAGVVAQLLQARPEWNPDDVKQALRETAESRGEGPNVEGAGYLDAGAAGASLGSPGSEAS